MALNLSTAYTGGLLPGAQESLQLAACVRWAHAALEKGTGQGAGMRGWLRFPASYPQDPEYRKILDVAAEIRANAEVLLVIGIGGSYLGARAVIEAVTSRYYNETRQASRKGQNEALNTPAIYFTGNTLSESDFGDLDRLIEGRDFYINVISKSGKTLETAVAFRHFRAKLEEKWGGADEVNRRIFVTTEPVPEAGKNPGMLLKEALAQGWTTFVVPKNMGGRYSVLSAVGLLPIACAGIDIGELLHGAADAQNAYAPPGETLEANPCDHYAALRYYYYKYRHRSVELFATYEPSMVLFGEWYKQLFGESEGKRGRGLFPGSVTFTTDLHSLGQYIQQGRRILFETVLSFGEPANAIAVKEEPGDGDGLNYLAGKSLYEINQKAFMATALAHAKGKCPSLVLELPRRDAYNIGWLIYFFERACATSGYMIGVNPFDQDGVEQYKNFMFALLGNADYGEERAYLRNTYHIDI